MKTIFEFKAGDKITRLKPATEFNDRSYIGDELTFIGIVNGKIYFSNKKSPFGEEYISGVHLDLWKDDWNYYVDPKNLLEGKEHIISSISIQEQIQRAIDNEDYELAEKLTKIIKK
jgi:hypothetical protein